MTTPAPLADVPGERPVLESQVVHRGLVWDVVRETVELGPYRTVVREYVRHPGAVAVIALDDDDRVLLLRQYRHPVGAELWEPPAGLLDMPGEDPVAAARRELAEEADLTATEWWLLAEYLTTPGGSDESLRVYLARGVAEVPHVDRHLREDEEADMEPVWIPLDEAVAGVLAGRFRNPSTAVGVLAAAAARSRGWADLRSVQRD